MAPTPQQGYGSPPATNGGTTNQPGMLGDISAWLAHPFQSQGSALNWILFVGLFIAAAWFWQAILLEITGALERE